VAATSPKKKQLIKDIFGSDDEQEEPKVVVPSPVKDEKQSQEGEVGCSQAVLRIRIWIRRIHMFLGLPSRIWIH
jgi:hypothetical protein